MGQLREYESMFEPMPEEGEFETLREAIDSVQAMMPPPGSVFYICRAIPGEHTATPDCWCSPRKVMADDDAAVQRAIEATDREEAS